MKTIRSISADDVKDICKVCASLRTIVEHFQTLFEQGDLRCELLHDTASMFFHDLNLILIDYLKLQICKITDDESQGKGRVNLTVKFFLKNSDFEATPHELEKLQRHSDAMHAFREKILTARNKLFAHLDLESMRAGTALGGTERADWTEFWLDLQAFLQILHKRYVEPDGDFCLNDVVHLSDADAVVKALKESKYFQSILIDKNLSQGIFDATASSKYFNA